MDMVVRNVDVVQNVDRLQKLYKYNTKSKVQIRCNQSWENVENDVLPRLLRGVKNQRIRYHLENRKYSLWYKLPGDNNKVERVKKKTEYVLKILDEVWDDILDENKNSTPKIIFDFTEKEEEQEQVQNTSVVISPVNDDKGVGAKGMSSNDNGNKQSKKRKRPMQKGGGGSIWEHLISQCPKGTPLVCACEKGHLEDVRMLVEGHDAEKTGIGCGFDGTDHDKKKMNLQINHVNQFIIMVRSANLEMLEKAEEFTGCKIANCSNKKKNTIYFLKNLKEYMKSAAKSLFKHDLGDMLESICKDYGIQNDGEDENYWKFHYDAMEKFVKQWEEECKFLPVKRVNKYRL
eukprot:g9174.t1